jgi:hypothetical protein
MAGAIVVPRRPDGERALFTASILELVEARRKGTLPRGVLDEWRDMAVTSWELLSARERSIRRTWFESWAEVGREGARREAQEALALLDGA